MSCRLPGAPNPDAFWQLLREGRDAIIKTPPERRSLYGLAEADESTQGLEYGGYLDRVDQFDAGFFGIAPREAASMDPQQRLMLELAWQALEDAGIPRDRLEGDETGVFVGAISSDYAGLLRRAKIAVARQMITGNQRSMIANRVSYFLGARGPSLTVDTGQSWASSPSTWPARACSPANRRWRWRAGSISTSGRTPPSSWLRSELSRRMAAASPSTRGRTASCAEREAAWWCSSRWTLPSPAAIGFSASSEAAPSTTTVVGMRSPRPIQRAEAAAPDGL